MCDFCGTELGELGLDRVAPVRAKLEEWGRRFPGLIGVNACLVFLGFFFWGFAAGILPRASLERLVLVGGVARVFGRGRFVGFCGVFFPILG